MAFEKVLPLPPEDRQVQLTIYHCGPASAENMLLSLGIEADEWELARACRTHEGGTDWIGQILEVLRERAHHMDWRLVEMPNDPCTPQEKQALWDNAVASICEAEAPMLMNFVAPQWNYPRASRPFNGIQVNPNYGGGTVYHYVSCFGLAEDSDGSRHMLIVDSGFNAGGKRAFWCSWDQVATLIPPKGYLFAQPDKVGVPTLPGPATALSEVEALSFAMGGALPMDRYAALLPAVKDALRQSNCTTPNRVAMWLSQIGHESGGLQWMRELSDGEYLSGRTDLGNRPGTDDGPRYRGAGPIQVTGRSNFAQVSEWAYAKGMVPTADYFVENPEELAGDTFGMLGAIWYWVVARGNQINEAADRADVVEATRLINGGDHGLDDRISRFHRALQVAEQLMPADEAPPAEPAREPAHARPDTPLTGRPHHHSQIEDLEGQLLNVRAEGLLTQAMVWAIAEAVGANPREVYDRVRDGF